MNKKAYGNRAEFLARLFLRLKGYQILEKNLTCGRGTTAGEVDIIAYHKNTLVFVEVKRRRKLEQAFYAISVKQQKRILNAAKFFFAQHSEFQGCDIRFDAVLIAGFFQIVHIKNAWQET